MCLSKTSMIYKFSHPFTSTCYLCIPSGIQSIFTSNNILFSTKTRPFKDFLENDSSSTVCFIYHLVSI